MSNSRNYKESLLHPKRRDSLQNELTRLAIKIIIIIVGSWIALYAFENFGTTILGFKHFHIQTAGSIITITIALATIIATRRILHKFSNKMHPQFSAAISFFIIIFIALMASISILYQWNVNPQQILVGGGVAAIVIGIGVSTIVGNIFSGGLMLTTFPAKIGDSIFIVNDNVRGKIEEITMMYTKIMTDQDTEYIVPNNAIIQGNIRITRETSLDNQMPFTEGDQIELTDSSGRYSGIVIKITPTFSTILNNERKKETIFANSTILSGRFVITKNRT